MKTVRSHSTTPEEPRAYLRGAGSPPGTGGWIAGALVDLSIKIFTVTEVLQIPLENLYTVYATENGGRSMRVLMACAIITAAVGLGGCFFHGGFHHQQAAVAQPLK